MACTDSKDFDRSGCISIIIIRLHISFKQSPFGDNLNEISIKKMYFKMSADIQQINKSSTCQGVHCLNIPADLTHMIWLIFCEYPQISDMLTLKAPNKILADGILNFLY